jgi:hypothetical protein
MLSTLGMPSVRIECEGWKLSVEALNIIATAPDGTLTTSYECLRRRVAATTPQISSSVPKRKHADAQPRSEDCARRSSRQRLAPLNFWLGERVIYEPGGSASGPRIAGVLRTSGSEQSAWIGSCLSRSSPAIPCALKPLLSMASNFASTVCAWAPSDRQVSNTAVVQ